MTLFNFFSGNRVTKSLPNQSGMTLETYVQAPLPLRNNPVDLVNMNRGYVWTCNKINSTALSACKFKIFSDAGAEGKSIGSWVKHRKIGKQERAWLTKQLPLSAMKSLGTMVEITDHPFLDLMESVSKSLDNFTLLEMTEQYLGLIGNAYWLIIKDVDGKPVEIELLPAEYISVLVDNEGKPTGYRQQVDGTGYRRDYPFEDVLHFKQPAAGGFRRLSTAKNVPTALYGMGSLEAVIEEAQLLQSINTYERTLMDNNGRPDFLVKYLDGSLDEKQTKKLQTQWDGIFKGLRRAGKTAILDKSFEIKELGFSPKDLSYQEGKKWLRTAISNAFGVHENFISVENANRSSSDMAIEQYYRFTILPKLRRIQEVINAGLMPMYDNGLWLCYDDPVPEAGDSTIKKEQADIRNGVVSINEIRISRGLEPYPEEIYNRPQPIGMSQVSTISTDDPGGAQ